MISREDIGQPPFTVIANVHDGHTRRFDTIEDATAYAAKLLDRCNVTTEVFNRRGVMVGSTETIIDGCPFEDGPAVA